MLYLFDIVKPKTKKIDKKNKKNATNNAILDNASK